MQKMQTKHTQVVALDGNVYSGKTTLAKIMSGVYVPEHTDFPIAPKPDPLDTQKEYLMIDNIRKRHINGGEVNFLDRSFISLCGHVWALYRSGQDIRKPFFLEMIKAIKKDCLIIPNSYVFVKCEYETALKRYNLGELEKPKRTNFSFITQEYFDSIDEWNLLWQKNCNAPTITIDTDIPLSKNAETLERFVSCVSDELVDPSLSLKKLLSL